MVMSEIQNKIDYYSGCYDDCSRRIDDLSRELQAAETCSTDLADYLRRLAEDMDSRKNRLSSLGGDSVRSKTLRDYYEGMSMMLSGEEYQQKYYNLDQGLARMNRAIDELGDELTQLSGQRDDAWSNKIYWEEQLPYAEDYPA